MGDISASPPSPTPNGRVNPLSIFLWTWESIVKSLVTLSNKKITWVKFHPDTPPPPFDPLNDANLVLALP
jgi:hypothetical protein